MNREPKSCSACRSNLPVIAHWTGRDDLLVPVLTYNEWAGLLIVICVDDNPAHVIATDGTNDMGGYRCAALRAIGELTGTFRIVRSTFS